ncbi:hypothetical protein TCAL_10699 [Tigriopus californicus]|uniref:Deacetylase sirtuin-type domain-containing protein n=1 Tax=Tigriopus californicus TaxID=6832 RepID=A0A553NZZ2_TIGCA|nr:NAD-dependent protein deacylase Sirt4-like [Tigriopus californicus]TRY71014.1 hypothetical protein TCAL_10699 [Tigriopus californicus]|eukprot:TCALIF_10699-PA protein Name:"Similar to Sirt4 NAD-dependent protein deacetylase Sirt4 (Drosophila melanogaster)" AED:0.03 eAED:0.03 QI:0/-1/0/1/-1/1/1/0/324
MPRPPLPGGSGWRRRLSGPGWSAPDMASPYVPPHRPVDPDLIQALATALAAAAPRLLVLTGAGLSTESGIPDYRSAHVGLYARSGRQPIQHRDFVQQAATRRRYWARNFVGWPQWAATLPNAAHRRLREWEAHGRLAGGIVTQNVDQLHFKAGSCRVIEMHGTNSTVACLNCCFRAPRWAWQAQLHQLNPDFPAITDIKVRPDGDVEIPPAAVENFNVPMCPRCKVGCVKPSVIFFGDNVPGRVLTQIEGRIRDCQTLFVIGSSLHVYSGYRMILQAQAAGKKVLICNIGPTRADHLTHLKVEGRASEVLAAVDAYWSTHRMFS